MEWSVMWLSDARNVARSITGVNSPEHEREISRSESVTTPVEMR
jgi:hypothetical protein